MSINGYGLANMRERAELLGGNLTINHHQTRNKN